MSPFKRIVYLFFAAVVFFAFAGNLHAAGFLDKGIAEFQKENYEEAAVFFDNAYKENPKNPQITMYLARTHREMQNYPEAVRFFKETIALDPKAEVRYQLADVLYGMGNNEEALGVIDDAIKAGVTPAQSNYLKGQILIKLKRNAEAVEAFNKAKELDPSLLQQADYMTATVYMQGKDYKKAKDKFRSLITADPTSDWASYSKDYLEAIDRMPKPYKFNLGFGYQFDDNVLAVPLAGADQQAVGVSKTEDWKKLYSLYGEYTLLETGPWNMKASYAFSSVNHNTTDYPKTGSTDRVANQDSISHTLSLMPSYNMEKGVIGLLLSYNYLEVDYTKYNESYTFNPSYTFVLTGNHMAQVFFKYKKDENNFKYMKIKFGTFPNNAEDKDAVNLLGGIGYFYAFKEGNGLISAKFELDQNDADGGHWDYTGFKESVGLLYPFLNNKLKANLYLELYSQDFNKMNMTYSKERRDDVITGQAALTYTIMNPLDVSVGYSHIRANSNIGVFDYKKNLYTLSFEYRF